MNGLSVTLGADIHALKHALSHAVKEVQHTSASMSGILSTGMKVGLGLGVAGLAAGLGFAVKSVMFAADFEQTKIAFSTIIGDAKVAEDTLAKLRKMSNETPFQFPEVADAARKLIAFGEGADTVVETTRMLGDVASGVQAPIGEIAHLYGKCRIEGRLYAREIREFSARGIPIMQILADQFGCSTQQIKKMVEEGKVGFPQVQQAFVSMTSKGGKFYNMMKYESQTTKGLWTTLMDVFNDVMLQFGTPINDAIRPLLKAAIGFCAKLVPLATRAGILIRDAIMFTVGMFKSGQFFALVGTTMKLGFAVGVNYLWKGLKATVAAVGQYFVEMVKLAILYFEILTEPDFWKGMGNALIGVCLSFLSFLQSGMVKLVEVLRPLAEFFDSGDLIDSAVSGLNDSIKVLDDEASDRYAKATGQLEPLLARVAKQWVSAWENISGKFNETLNSTPDIIDTSDMRQDMEDIMNLVRAATPEVTRIDVPTTGIGKEHAEGSGEVGKALQPIVSTMGKVGGGGYMYGTLDLQRENNRLTAQTNAHLAAIKDKMLGKSTKIVGVFG